MLNNCKETKPQAHISFKDDLQGPLYAVPAPTHPPPDPANRPPT